MQEVLHQHIEDEEGFDVCTAVRELLEDSRKEGMAEGIKESISELTEKIAKNMFVKGYSAEEIVDATGISADDVARIREKLSC